MAVEIYAHAKADDFLSFVKKYSNVIPDRVEEKVEDLIDEGLRHADWADCGATGHDL